MPPGYPGLNRRRHKRQPGRFDLQFRVAGQENLPAQTATTLDISSQNLAFTSPQAIPLGARLRGELQLPQAARPIRFQGIVRRIGQERDGAVYSYGVVFEEIDPKDQAYLERFAQISDIYEIFRAAIKSKASDIHLVAHQPPIFRVEGSLTPQNAFTLSPDDLQEMIFSLLSERQRELFLKNLELDFSYLSPDGMRFRGNIHTEKGNIEASFRIIPKTIRSLRDLGLPPVVEELAKRKKGLVLIAGPTGCGKSTTLAAMIELINRYRKCMIMSIEDPIEYVHQSQKSIIKQREVGRDTLSFNQALKHVLRQDVDVILVGEMRDIESISMVISAAETGHLVLSTLHTADTTECLNRIIDAYPDDQQFQIRTQLAGCLEGIVTQYLIPRKDGEGRVLATEVLICTPAIRNLVRSGQLGQIPIYLESGSEMGMRTMDSSLQDLVRRGLIGKETAITYARDQKKFLDTPA
jgi:twitching motility protein PilT